MIDLTPIFNAIIVLLAAIVTHKIVPWVVAKTTNEQQAMLRATIRTLVFAAEQVYGAGSGSAKLQYVVEQLEAQGYTVDMNEIEAAVKENISALHTTKTTETEYTE